MISPASYIARFENADYSDLIEERNRLIAYIRDFEKKEIAGDRSGEKWQINLDPTVIYQCYLEYLAELCKLMKKKYNEEYVWGDKSLAADYYNCNTKK